MNGSQYVSQRWIRGIFSTTVLFLVLLVGMMIVSLNRTAKKLDASITGVPKKTIAQSFSHEKYDNLIKEFKEPYVPLNAHRRSVFSLPAGVTDIPKIEPIPSDVDFSDMRERLRVKKIYKKPVKLLFKGYMQLGDSSYVATINWAGKTDFKKVGDVIRGYKLVDFKKNVSEQKTLWGGTEKLDQSFISLERDTGEKFNLDIGKVTLEKEIYAEIWDRKEVKSYEVYIGADILENKVLDISAEEVIITTPNGEKLSLIKKSN